MNNEQIIKIRGVRTHNLKNLNVDIKQNKITCILGPSGSGKSSLAFHTILTESKRRYINSLPSDMKFFWEIPHTVDVDHLSPVLPAWGLPQHNPVIHSRPVVLDVLGGHEKLQKLFFHLGEYYCSTHQVPYISKKNYEDLINIAKKLKLKNTEDEVVHFFVSKSEYLEKIKTEILPSRSFTNHEKGITSFSDSDEWWEIFRLKYNDFNSVERLEKKFSEFRLPEEVKFLVVFGKNKKDFYCGLKTKKQCPLCDEEEDSNLSVDAISPLNALGACKECQGHGMKLVYDKNKLVKDPTKSLREGAVNILSFSHFQHLIPVMLREAKKEGFDIDEPFENLPQKIWNFLYKGQGSFEGLEELFEYLDSKKYKKTIRIYSRGLQSEEICKSCDGSRISTKLSKLGIKIEGEIINLKKILISNLEESLTSLEKIANHQKQFHDFKKIEVPYFELMNLYKIAKDIGLSHLSNTRKIRSVSSSEYQRILLSKFLSYKGSQSLFVLDEPSLGLSLATQKTLFKYLKELRDQGNTIILVEHSEYLQSVSDEIIQMGPRAGEFGGEIIYQGKYRVKKEHSYEIDKFKISKKEFFGISNVKIRHLEFKQLELLKNGVNLINGESGTGKTSLVVDVLANEIHRQLNGTKLSYEYYTFEKIYGAKSFKSVVVINGSVDKVSSRSTVGTYTELASFIKKHFTKTEEAKKLDLKEGHFSANSELGMCLECMGRGVKTVEMHFMEDVEFVCDECKGMKLKPFYAKISDGTMTVHEAMIKPLNKVLMSIDLTPKGKRIYEYMKKLKIDYLNIDRSLTSLSGGERQRLYLLSLLSSKLENSLIVFENLSSGLSIDELVPLSELLHHLCGSSNTIVVIDQHPIFEKVAHHLVTLTK